MTIGVSGVGRYWMNPLSKVSPPSISVAVKVTGVDRYLGTLFNQIKSNQSSVCEFPLFNINIHNILLRIIEA